MVDGEEPCGCAEIWVLRRTVDVLQQPVGEGEVRQEIRRQIAEDRRRRAARLGHEGDAEIPAVASLHDIVEFVGADLPGKMLAQEERPRRGNREADARGDSVRQKFGQQAARPAPAPASFSTKRSPARVSTSAGEELLAG